ncbi:hypothetical protein TNIN_407381 [Trichonephila inaurata madagascariensis]|uniref:Uncharacterized protein n=1 Tax=Trichonephila inaurata madagascariensis TaxID=2747483 RepID=A0A8X6YKW3_9ARAC|nr:hypothetical protein TNIN_407381 [Trichonephila inaurata madagascariensis]
MCTVRHSEAYTGPSKQKTGTAHRGHGSVPTGKVQVERHDHPPYSPDMSPCNFHVFGSLEKHLKVKHFNSNTL